MGGAFWSDFRFICSILLSSDNILFSSFSRLGFFLNILRFFA